MLFRWEKHKRLLLETRALYFFRACKGEWSAAAGRGFSPMSPGSSPIRSGKIGVLSSAQPSGGDRHKEEQARADGLQQPSRPVAELEEPFNVVPPSMRKANTNQLQSSPTGQPGRTRPASVVAVEEIRETVSTNEDHSSSMADAREEELKLSLDAADTILRQLAEHTKQYKGKPSESEHDQFHQSLSPPRAATEQGRIERQPVVYTLPEPTDSQVNSQKSSVDRDDRSSTASYATTSNNSSPPRSSKLEKARQERKQQHGGTLSAPPPPSSYSQLDELENEKRRLSQSRSAVTASTSKQQQVSEPDGPQPHHSGGRRGSSETDDLKERVAMLEALLLRKEFGTGSGQLGGLHVEHADPHADRFHYQHQQHPIQDRERHSNGSNHYRTSSSGDDEEYHRRSAHDAVARRAEAEAESSGHRDAASGVANRLPAWQTSDNSRLGRDRGASKPSRRLDLVEEDDDGYS